MNHDIEAGDLGMSSIRKWALVAEAFQPTTPVSVDTARFQRQIEEQTARLESTQLRVVTEPKKTVQFDKANKEESVSRSREPSSEPYRGRTTRESSPEPYRASEPYRGRGTRPQLPEPYRTSGNQTTGSRRGTLNYGRGGSTAKGDRQGSNSAGSTARTPLMTAPSWQSADQRGERTRDQSCDQSGRQRDKPQQTRSPTIGVVNEIPGRGYN